MYGWFQGIYNWIFSFLDVIIQSIQQGIQALLAVLSPVLQFFAGILYLFQRLMQVIWYILQVGWGIVDLLIAVVGGFFRTLTSLIFVPFTADYPITDGQQYTDVFIGFFNTWGFSTIPLIIMVFVWLATAWGIIRIIRGGSS